MSLVQLEAAIHQVFHSYLLSLHIMNAHELARSQDVRYTVSTTENLVLTMIGHNGINNGF